MQTKPTLTYPLTAPSGRIVLDLELGYLDEDGEPGPTEIHLDEWSYTPPGKPSPECPGDPAQLRLDRAWRGDTGTDLDAAELDRLLGTHRDVLLDEVADYEGRA